MSSLRVIRKAVADTLKDPTIEGLSTYEKIVPQINYPGVVVHPEEANYTKAFKRGLVQYEISLLVLVGGLEAYASQELLDELITPSGPKSIVQAIDNNRTLGLPDCDAHVSELSAYWVRYLSAHIGARLKLNVVTPG